MDGFYLIHPNLFRVLVSLEMRHLATRSYEILSQSIRWRMTDAAM
jgi:hypothetical protein